MTTSSHPTVGRILRAPKTAEIIAAVESRDARALRAALVRYHRRRERIVPELLERLYSN